MSIELKLAPNLPSLNMYDRATGKNVMTEKIVDITADCTPPEPASKCLLLFGRDSRHRICQITYCDEEYETLSLIWFAFDEPRQPVTFGLHAHDLGFSFLELLQLMQHHAPA